MIHNYTNWIFVNKDTIKREKFESITNIGFIKPNGGLWLAPYNKNNEYKSEWHNFLVNEMYIDIKSMKGTIVRIKENAKILVIDSLDDLKKIFEKYELYLDIPTLFRVLDFEKLSKDYDAILLTEKGQWLTRLSQPNLYGWDIESMLVMNFDIIEEDLIIDL